MISRLISIFSLLMFTSVSFSTESSDYNGDGVINLDDFFILADAWENDKNSNDINGDGEANEKDISDFIYNFNISAKESLQARKQGPIEDEGYIIYMSIRDKQRNLVSMKPDGRDITQLLITYPNNISNDIENFCISPDGSLLALTFIGIPKIYWVKPFNEKLAWSFAWIDEGKHFERLRCSPDGMRILFDYFTIDRIFDSQSTYTGFIYINDPQPQYTTAIRSHHASWSSDTSIVFSSGLNGHGLWERDLNTDDIVLLEEGLGHIFPIYDKNSGLLAFASRNNWDIDRGYTSTIYRNIFLKNLNTNRITSVNSIGENGSDLSFSPTKSHILFQRNRNLYITDLTGKEWPLVIDETEWAEYPAWIDTLVTTVVADSTMSAIPESNQDRIRGGLLDLGYRFTIDDFLEAAGAGDTTAVELFLDGGMPIHTQVNDKYGDKYEFALWNATSNGHLDMVRFLLLRGASPNQSYGFGSNTPLMTAAARGDNEIIKLLVSHGARIETSSEDDNTAIFSAIREQRIETVQLLLDLGATPHRLGHRGSTTLMRAARTGSLELTQIILRENVSIDAKNKDGENALYEAVGSDNLEIAKLLLDRGAIANVISDRSNMTPLMVAALLGNMEMVHLLIENGADVGATRPSGENALTVAARWEKIGAAQLLLEAGTECQCDLIELSHICACGN